MGQGDPVRRRLAFEHIGRSPDSSTSHILNSAATSGYGVIKGGKNAPHLELTQNGKRIVESVSRKERREAELDILFNNSYFAALVEKYAERQIPQDSIAIDYLQREQNLEQSDAETFWEVAKDNMFEFGLLESSNSKQVVLSREYAKGLEEDADKDERGEVVEEDTGDQDADGAAEPSGQGQDGSVNPMSKSRSIVPQIAFNIQVILPENATAETYNAIFESMAVHLLGRSE